MVKMKKVMEIDLNSGHMFFDVSTTELMNEAYKWLFKHCGVKEQMKYDTNQYEKEIKDAKCAEECPICNRTGKVSIVGYEDAKVTCPRCKGFRICKAELKRWEETLAVYERALAGNMTAIKKMIHDHSGHLSGGCYEVHKVATPK